jgi:ubiquitin-activating enzyme E1
MVDTVMNESSQLDENFYCKTIGTFGMETMEKLSKMRVLIVGMRGLGAETAKNLILSGPASVDIYDNEVATHSDMSANFILTEEHVQNKTPRAAACVQRLQEFNSYVKVSAVDKLSTDYDIVVFTEN